MTEQRNPYLGLPPESLKIHIVSLFDQLPFWENDEEKRETARERRSKSRFGRIFTVKAGQLLECARPFTTRGFRVYLGQELEGSFIEGINKQNLSGEPLFHLLGLDFPQGNSIYDPRLVPILESRGYTSLLDESVSFERISSQYRGGGWDEGEDLKREPYHTEKSLQKWRREYIAKFGDEP